MSQELERLLQAGYRYALSLCADPADAQDLVQESWVRLLARHGQVIERALLFRAIRNLYIDGYRHRRRFPTDSLEAGGGDVPTDAASKLDEPTDPALQCALSRLADIERETLFLAVIEGWTAAEIAAATDRPRGTVLSMLHRCRRKLRGWLEEGIEQAPSIDAEVPEPGSLTATDGGGTSRLRVIGGKGDRR